MATNIELDEYTHWAREELGIRFGADIACVVVDAKKQERGVVARQALDQVPQELLNVPLESLLTVLSIPLFWQKHIKFFDVSSRLQANSSDEMQEDGHEITNEWNYQDQEDDQLAILLLYERFLRGTKSKWNRHLQHLPTQYHNLLFFTDDEMDCLRGSNLFFVAKDLQQQILLHFQRLQDKVLPPLIDLLNASDDCSSWNFADVMATDGGSSPSVAVRNEFLAKVFSIENYRWALSTIWSRFVTMEYEEEEDGGSFKSCVLKAMVPVFDFFNHRVDAQVTHFYDYQTKSFRLISHQPWQANEQLFLSYGTLSNHKLLTLYGFVHDHHQQRQDDLHVNSCFDCVELWIPMEEMLPPEHQSSVKNKPKTLLFLQQFLQENTPQCDVNQCSFELTLGQVNPLLLRTLRIATIHTESYQQFEQQASVFWTTRRTPDEELSEEEDEEEEEPKQLPPEQEKQMLERLALWLETVLQSLVLQTQRKKDHDQDGSVTSYHCHMAQVILESDAHVLRTNLDMLHAAMQELDMPQK